MSFKPVTMRCADGKDVVISKDNILQMKTLCNILEMRGEEEEELQDIPLENVSSSTMNQILKYCSRERSLSTNSETVKPLKKSNFFKKLHLQEILELFNAADFLEMESLFSTCAKEIADKLSQMTLSEIRLALDIQDDDGTPEEMKNKLFQEYAEHKCCCE